ncbi:MAG TPA: hypothetical protein VI750_03725 [Pyrinomonadaceae bacterium]|nr:hypothetical protein [Pyrinomonadaceae bacterium]
MRHVREFDESCQARRPLRNKHDPRASHEPTRKSFRVEYASHFIGHEFRVYSEDELDAEVQAWLREAYKVGAQLNEVSTTSR